MKIAEQSVDEHLSYYLRQLKGNCKNSFLEELDDLNLSVIYKRFISNSVGYLLFSRCGLDTEIYFENEDFSDIFNFSTVETVNSIGFAVNNIAQPILKEISAEVNQAQNFHLFAVEKKSMKWYDINNITPERNDNDDRQNNLYEICEDGCSVVAS